jgi:REP element-mobilizing transposase RayT
MGNHGENIFREKEDYMIYLELLKKYKEQDGFKLFSFVMMPQQLNLLIEATEKATISTIMHDIASSYTKYFNNRYQRKGHLFQERFKSVIVEKEPYLLSMVSYMHMAPVSKGLAQDPSLYPYSSHFIYLDSQVGNTEAGMLKDRLNLNEEAKEVTEAIAKFWPDKKSFSEFFASLPQKELKELGDRLHRSSILGSGQFLEKVRAQMNSRTEQPQEEAAPIEEKKSNLVPVLSVSAVVLLVGAVTLLYIYNTNILRKEKTAVSRNKISLPAQTPENALLLTELDGTEWTIQVRSASGGQTYYDKLEFKQGEVSSKTMSEKGFNPSRYNLKIREDGTFTWETMQRSGSGEISFWRGETDTAGKMSGGFSRQPQGEQAQDFSYSSLQYIYRR